MFNHLAHMQSSNLTKQAKLFHGFYGQPDQKIPGDDPNLFAAQIKYVADQIQIPAARMIEVNQIHSAKARPVAAPWAAKMPEADAMVTDATDLALVIKTADCAPVLLADPGAGVIGAAHAGWRGARAGILEQTIMHMTFLGAKRQQIIASIGPCIAQTSYEVDAEFAEEFLSDSLINAQFFLQPKPPKLQFDLGGFCAYRLQQAGVENLQVLPMDTVNEKNQFFSYRRSRHHGESGYGRNLSVICLLAQ